MPDIESRIREASEAQGIMSAYQLWRKLVEQIPNASKATAYKLWAGTFKRVDRDTLEVLCKILNCEAGPIPLLTYTPDSKPKTSTKRANLP